MEREVVITPFELKILLHIYAIADVLPEWDIPLTRDTVAVFLQDGIIKTPRVWSADHAEIPPQQFSLSERGNAWVEMILSTPYPVHRWADPRLEDD